MKRNIKSTKNWDELTFADNFLFSKSRLRLKA